ncbi:MAG: hypothetical protein OCD01_06510 [Fibrobacterales bacterium]
MSDMQNEIIPKVGLGDIRFGMDRDAVKAILGAPDECDIFSYNEDDTDRSEGWFWFDLEISANFDEEDDWKLVSLSADSERFLLKGQKVIGIEKAALEALLATMDITDIDCEDHSSEDEPNHELVATDSVGLNFWLDEGIVTEVQWGPFINDDDSIDWPK